MRTIGTKSYINEQIEDGRVTVDERTIHETSERTGMGVEVTVVWTSVETTVKEQKSCTTVEGGIGRKWGGIVTKESVILR